MAIAPRISLEYLVISNRFTSSPFNFRSSILKHTHSFQAHTTAMISPLFARTQQSQHPVLDSIRTFEFRLNSTHTARDNSLSTLHVEYLTNADWQPFDLNIETRGFLIFGYSCFICQHTYLRMNATELGLSIAFVDGKFQLTTSNDWIVSSVTADFDLYLVDGVIDRDGTQYLINRMKGCPVSRNLGGDVIKNTQLTIHPFQPQLSMPQPELVRSPQSQGSQQYYKPPTLTKLTNSTILSLNSSGL